MKFAEARKKPATPWRLVSGEWGAFVPEGAKIGDWLTITSRSGKSWTALVEEVVSTSSEGSIVAVTYNSWTMPAASAANNKQE